MSAEYQSFKFKTTHFNIKNIQDYLINNLPYSLESYELDSSLSSEKLNSILSILFSKTFFFDKMEVKSETIETIRYLYLSSVDSNMNFISSCDSEFNIDSKDLYNVFLQQINDSNSNYLIDSSTNIKYNCFEYNSFYFIGMMIPMGTHTIMVIVETYQDDSVMYESIAIQSSELDYGFPILSENQVFLNNLQDPNTSMFEYAS